MTVLVRIIQGEEDGYSLYDMQVAVVPRKGDTLTMRFPDRTHDEYEVVRVNHLIEVKTGGLGISDDLVAVRVYVRQISPAIER
ncbi:hypothetical protein [Sphingomonas sp. IW22]|uniref:hypothetical protein n=1 Tax=Sphingomonas sp. IW22 TaxID=3242489 RepID=UPI0035213E1A